jgi:hypothetical protein
VHHAEIVGVNDEETRIGGVAEALGERFGGGRSGLLSDGGGRRAIARKISWVPHRKIGVKEHYRPKVERQQAGDCGEGLTGCLRYETFHELAIGKKRLKELLDEED